MEDVLFLKKGESTVQTILYSDARKKGIQCDSELHFITLHWLTVILYVLSYRVSSILYK